MEGSPSMAPHRYCTVITKLIQSVIHVHFLYLLQLRWYFFLLIRASSRASIWMRSCTWVVIPTTRFLLKPLALSLALWVRFHTVYTVTEIWSREDVFCVWWVVLSQFYVGCIRQLVIQGEEVIFKDLDRSSTGVTNCPTCKDHPCQVSLICQHHTLLVFLPCFSACFRKPVSCIYLEWRKVWGFRCQLI